MARQEATNTFNDGMIKDLNPINTPNTALTDCLNGTIITYDGNEYSLQNDKGNYELENCKLKPNYIPIGTSEYNGILYIISYNPIEEKVEIGSFPSTRQVLNTNTTEDAPEILVRPLNPLTGNYSDLVKTYCKLQTFYGVNPNKWKINPGDRFQIVDPTNNRSAKYQKIDFYILGENKELYDLSNFITDNNFNYVYNEDDFKNVTWQIPGWLGAKLRIASIENFGISLKDFVVPTYIISGSTVQMKLKFRVETFDELIYNEQNPELKVKVSISIDGTPVSGWTNKIVELSNSNKTNLYNGSYSFWAVTDTISGAITQESEITVEAVPMLGSMVYDNCRKVITYSISNKKSLQNYTLGDKTWKYSIMKDSNGDRKLIITFDTEGLSDITNFSDLTLKYSLYRFNSQRNLELVKNTSGNNYSNIEVEGWNLDGYPTDITLPIEVYQANTQRLVAEDLYVIEFNLYSGNTIIPSSLTKKLIIASELMNSFEDKNLNNITFEKWISTLSSHIQNKSLKIDGWTNATLDSSSTGAGGNIIVTIGNSGEYNTWTSDNAITNYNTFMELKSLNNFVKNGFSVTGSVNYNSTITYTSDIQFPCGPIWYNTLHNIYLSSCIKNEENTQFFDEYTGKIKSNNLLVSETITDTYKKSYNFKADVLLSNSKVWNYNPQTSLKVGTESLNFNITNVSKDKYSNVSMIGSKGSTSSIAKISDLGLSKSALREISKTISKDNAYDILLLKVKLSLNDDVVDKATLGAIYCLKGLSSDKGSGSTHSARTATEHYFLALPSSDPNNEMNLIYINALDASQALTKLNTTTARIKHIICDGNTVIKGGFVKAVSNVDNYKSEDTKIQLSGFIKNIPFSYLGYNLLKESDRKNFNLLLSSNSIISKNFATEEDISSIPDILLNDIDKNIPIEIPSNISTAIDNSLNLELDKIEERNLAIEEQLRNYNQDSTFRKYNESSDEYVTIITDSSSKTSLESTIESILNKRVVLTENKLRYWIHTWYTSWDFQDDWGPEVQVGIGYTDPNITIT